MRVYSYPFTQTWPAALRLLRVDEGCRIVEKDADAGYVLFELSAEGKTFSGSLELVRLEDGQGRAATKAIVTVAQRPAYTEQGLLDRLGRKLREEIGDPPPPPPPPRDDEKPRDKDRDRDRDRPGPGRER